LDDSPRARACWRKRARCKHPSWTGSPPFSWPRRLARDLAAATRGNGAALASNLAAAVRHLSNANRDPLLFPKRVHAYEREEGVPSSWFFLTVSEDAEGRRYSVTSRPFRSFLRRLARDGSEVGLHGSIQSSGSAEAMTNERLTIEQVAGHPVEGNRQHYLVLSASGTFWDLAQAGIRHDSSLGFSDVAAFRAGTSLPFRPYDIAREEPIDLIELPLAVMDVALIAPMQRDVVLDPMWRTLLDRQEAIGGLLTVLWHPRMFDPETHPAGRAPYEALVREARARELPFVTARDAARWWRARDQARLAEMSGRVADAEVAGGGGDRATPARAAGAGAAMRLRYECAESVERITIVVHHRDAARIRAAVSPAPARLVASRASAAGDALLVTVGPVAAGRGFEITLEPR
jgi:hypothetical protein